LCEDLERRKGSSETTAKKGRMATAIWKGNIPGCVVGWAGEIPDRADAVVVWYE
jgi:hypothetical protein